MTQEQREHAEAMLIDMMEKLPKRCICFEFKGEGTKYEYAPEALQAAASAAHALIALEKSAPKVRVFGKPLDETPPVRGINAELSNKEELTADEAWELVEKAIWNSPNHHAAAEFNKLPPLVRKAVGRPEQLRDWNLVFRRGTLRNEVESNFREAFRSVTEPERRHGGEARRIVVKGVVHVDTTELDAALAKAERLERILRGIRVGGGTESQPERDATQEDMDSF